VREKLLTALNGSDEDEILRSYLIMERIRPPLIDGQLLINGQIYHESTLSEFGFYSAMFS